MLAFHHTGWTVKDLDRSLDFYVGLLGMEIVHKRSQDHPYLGTLVGLPGASIRYAILKLPDGGAVASNHLIELIQYLEPQGGEIAPRPCDAGAAHFAFITDDCLAMYERLSSRGVAFANPPVAIQSGINQGGYGCYLRDPDGFTLELLQPPAWRLQQMMGQAAESPPTTH